MNITWELSKKEKKEVVARTDLLNYIDAHERFPIYFRVANIYEVTRKKHASNAENVSGMVLKRTLTMTIKNIITGHEMFDGYTITRYGHIKKQNQVYKVTKT